MSTCAPRPSACVRRQVACALSRAVCWRKSRRSLVYLRGFRGLEVFLEEVVQERANHGDGGKLADVIPGGREDGGDDVGSQRELEAEEQPHAETLPHELPRSV